MGTTEFSNFCGMGKRRRNGEEEIVEDKEHLQRHGKFCSARSTTTEQLGVILERI
jgi:hypothetical protein